MQRIRSIKVEKRSSSPEAQAKLSRKEQEEFDRDWSVEKNEIDRQFLNYKLQPTTYLSYEQDWETYWKFRVVQLQIEGVQNPLKYDFSTEWSSYFLKLLNIYKQKVYLDAKAKIYEKIYEKRKRQEQEQRVNMKRSRQTRSRSRSRSFSPRRNRRTKSRSRSRSSSFDRYSGRNKKVYSRSRSHSQRSSESRSWDEKYSRSTHAAKNSKFDHHDYRQKNQKKIKHSAKDCNVVSICCDMLEISELSSTYFKSLDEMKNKALNYQKNAKREYCMNKKEGEFMLNTSKSINSMLRDKLYSKHNVKLIKEIRDRIELLIRRWNIFTDNGRRFKELERLSQKFMLTQNRASSNSSSSKRLKLEEKRQKNNDRKPVDDWPNEYEWDTPGKAENQKNKQPKEEKQGSSKKVQMSYIHTEYLAQERANIKQDLKKQYDKEEKKVAKVSINQSESLENDAMKEVVKEKKDKSTDMTNEEIIGLLEIFEELPETEKELLMKLMEEIETAEPDRFKYLAKFIYMEDV